MSANFERTYLMVKPDGVHRKLVGEIIKRLEQKGFKLVALKFVQVLCWSLGQYNSRDNRLISFVLFSMPNSQLKTL